MKSLRQYLTESVRTYHYTIKIAGDLDKNFIEMFKYNLNKFDPVSVSDPKTIPIMKDPYGFPDLKNESVHIFKAEFKYPATEPMIQQMAQLLGKNINSVRVISSQYDDSINSENDQYANQASPLITSPYETDSGAEQANKDYGNQYLDKVLPKEPSITIDYAAKKTPTAPNKSKENIQTKSPMTSVSRPPKPATGARK